MNPNLILVRVIALLFKESHIKLRDGSAIELCKDVVEKLPTPEAIETGHSIRDTFIQLKSVATSMADKSIEYVHDMETVKTDVLLAIGDSTQLKDIFESLISVPDSEGVLINQIRHYKRELYNYIDLLEAKQVVMDAYKKIVGAVGLEWKEHFENFAEKIEPLLKVKEFEDGRLTDRVSLNNAEEVLEILEKSMKEAEGETTLRTGWQDINRMFGYHNGHRLGDMGLISALQHNFKSGTILNLFRHYFTYNKPVDRDRGKPLILLISFENFLTDNIYHIYRQAYENKYQRPLVRSDIDLKEAVTFINEIANENGWTVEMLRFDPTDFTIRDWIELHELYRKKGYDIQVSITDYLNMMSKKGCSGNFIGGATGMDVRELFRRARNYGTKNQMLTITPHQLSTQAKELLRMGTDDFVKNVANKGYYDGCKTIDQEVDWGLIAHKVVAAGRAFMTYHREKHRGMVTPEEHLYTVKEFCTFAELPDDVEGKDLSLKRIPGTVGDLSEW